MGANGPLEAAGGHGVKIGFGGLGAGPLPGLDTGGIHPLEHLGVRADDRQGRGPVVQQPVEFRLLIVGKFKKHRPVGLEIPLAGDKIVRPVQHDIPSAAVQGGGCTKPGQGRALHWGGDAGSLARLEVHAYLHQQMSVFGKLFFEIGNHGKSSPLNIMMLRFSGGIVCRD